MWPLSSHLGVYHAPIQLSCLNSFPTHNCCTELPFLLYLKKLSGEGWLGWSKPHFFICQVLCQVIAAMKLFWYGLAMLHARRHCHGVRKTFLQRLRIHRLIHRLIVLFVNSCFLLHRLDAIECLLVRCDSISLIRDQDALVTPSSSQAFAQEGHLYCRG